MSRYRSDARLWARLSDVLQTGVGQDMDKAKADRFARVLVAVVRRDQQLAGTWGPGDPLPDPAPRRVFDVDGAVWEHQQETGHGWYRMAAADRAKFADAGADYETLWMWDHLLDTEGPLTAIRMRDTGGGGG